MGDLIISLYYFFNPVLDFIIKIISKFGQYNMLLVNRGVRTYDVHCNYSEHCNYSVQSSQLPMHKNEDQVRDNIDTCNHEAPCTHPLFFFSLSNIIY